METTKEFSQNDLEKLVKKKRFRVKTKQFLPFLKRFPNTRRRIKATTLWFQLLILRILNPRATHVFFYSAHQWELIHRPSFHNPRMHDCLFRGKVYTETQEIGTRIKYDFLDGKIIGVGSGEEIKIRHFKKW